MHTAFTPFRTPTARTALAAIQAAVSRGLRILVQYAFKNVVETFSFDSQIHVASKKTRDSLYEGWDFNSGNYLFRTDTK